LLPYDFNHFTDTIQKYADELDKNSGSQRATKSMRRNRTRRGAVFSAIAYRILKKDAVQSKMEDVPPFLNFGAVAQRPGEVAAQAGRTLSKRPCKKLALDRALAAANRQSAQVERALTLPDGLPGAPWFKHQIYAPGMYTGYGGEDHPRACAKP